MKTGSALLLCAVCLSAASSHAEDWPRLGGPNGCGVSSETGLARHWPEQGPKLLWSIAVGQGFGGAAVYQREVFILDRVGNQDLLRCLELGTGRELWKLAYDAPGTFPYNGSRNVPTVDDNCVYILGAFGHFHCIDRRNHQIAWTHHLINDFKVPEIDVETPPKTREDKLARTQVPMWGFTQAPLLCGDMVIIAPQTQKTGLVAYDKASGKERWRSGYIGRNWYSHLSPCLTTLCGVEQIIMLAQPSDPEKSPDDAPPAIISSVDPATGQILWTTKTPGPHKIPIAQPLRVGEDRLFITGAYRMGALMLEISRPGGQWQTRVLFHNKTVAGHIHSPVLYRDHIYLTSLKEQGGKNCGLVCLNTDGELAWQTGPALQFESGAFLLADGLAYVMHGKTGQLHLIELASDGPRLLAKAKVLEAKNGKVWAPMALSEGKLLIRDQNEMKCLNVRPPDY